MEGLLLRSMTAAEFAVLRSRLIREYAAEKARIEDFAEDAAESLSAARFDSLLPEGPGTAGMLLLAADNQDGEQVGLVWLALNQPRPGEVWIYYIEVSADYRGKGYGRALLQAAEERAAGHDARAIALNVFGGNVIARRLYESTGYAVAAISMRKELTARPARPARASSAASHPFTGGQPGCVVDQIQVTIRGYEPRDAADIADVFYRSVRNVASSDYTAEQVEAWAPQPVDAEHEHRRSGDGRLVLVAADQQDSVAAFIDLEPDGHIDRLYCAPEAAGKGIATQLYEAIEVTARAQGIKRLFTEASELARRFFERKGFIVLGRQDMVLRGVPIHNFRMAKDLSETEHEPAREAAGRSG